MTCRQLGGSCDMTFHAETFEDMAMLSKQHGTEMADSGDREHLKAMESMKQLMNEAGEMEEWMEKKRQEFDSIPDDKQE